MTTLAPLKRGARIAACSTALAGVALGIAAPPAMADRIDHTSPYGYLNENNFPNILGGFDKPAGMKGTTSIAFCVEMGVVFPSSSTSVVKQAVTNEYPEIAYVINKYGENRDDLNQAAVQYLVHQHLDVHDDAFQSKYGIGPGDSSLSDADYEASKNMMLNRISYNGTIDAGAKQDIESLANKYWAEAVANASTDYTLPAPKIAVDGTKATITGFNILKDDGKPVAGSTKITVNLTGDAVFDDGTQSKAVSLADAAKGLRVTSSVEGGEFGVTYSATGLPTNELVIAQMAAHDGGDGYDGTGTFPAGTTSYEPGSTKPDRTGDATQTLISAIAKPLSKISGTPVTANFEEPTAETKAADIADGDKYVQQVGGTVTDTITYTGLTPGQEYTVEGALMDKAAGADSEPIATAKATFTPKTSDGTTTVEFELPADARGKTLVAFETIKNGTRIVAEHKDINDEPQTVHVMDFRTFMGGSDTDDTGRQFLAQTGGQITDEVQYSNFKPNTEYTVRGELMDRETGKSTGITAKQGFTSSETGRGTVEVTFDIPAEHAGKDLVAFQAIYEGDLELAADRNLDNNMETVYIADLATQARDAADGDQNIVQSGATIVDTVTYENLVPGEEHTVTGVLVDKETGKPVLDADGKEITGSATFTPETKDGEVKVEFKDLPAEAGGKTLVAFEAVKDSEGTIVAEHKDIEDEEQTIYVAGVGTTAVDSADGDKSVAWKGGKVTDTVEYKNLVPGTEYTVNGVLMDKDSGEELKGEDGKPVTASTTFTPEEANGKVDLEFTLPEDAEGKTLVAFETVLDAEGEVVAEHKDIEDEEQTTYVSKIRTEAFDESDKDKQLAYDGVIIDTVTYENLVPGQEYTIKGVLMDKVTGDPILDDVTGEEIVSEATFTPDSPNGETDVRFDLGRASDRDIVVFETLYTEDGRVQAEHRDLNDLSQTVHTSHYTPPPPEDEEIPPTPPEPEQPAPEPPAPTPPAPQPPAQTVADSGSGDAGAGLARTGAQVGGVGLLATLLGALGIGLHRARRGAISDLGE